MYYFYFWLVAVRFALPQYDVEENEMSKDILVKLDKKTKNELTIVVTTSNMKAMGELYAMHIRNV